MMTDGFRANQFFRSADCPRPRVEKFKFADVVFPFAAVNDWMGSYDHGNKGTWRGKSWKWIYFDQYYFLLLLRPEVDVILCCWLGSKHQKTNWLTVLVRFSKHGSTHRLCSMFPMNTRCTFIRVSPVMLPQEFAGSHFLKLPAFMQFHVLSLSNGITWLCDVLSHWPAEPTRSSSETNVQWR